MVITDAGPDGCKIIEPDIFGDNRGWFYESYSLKKLEELGINTVFVQDNRSFSAFKNTVRGLHCQTEPMAQTKLITCTRGCINDFVVDIRKGSPTYMKWVKVELSDENKRLFYIPRGFLHGFVTVSDNVEVLYKVDNFYSREHDRSVCYDDPEIGIDWNVSSPLLSAKDASAPLLKDSDVSFVY
ncbi:MAG: dTDP-4-dehydrorhamnose 3,5-epimerase [Clostridiales bacterium]|nr:dTDP-4-dehydrorhamnose 3,5-epimerase [Clostridiales bacterium]